ncbi:MAG TPA: tetratricopeptide repeat protein, partial [Candidatus Dormibacteraeota bacterium]|nr:tetratricopeptide repeat protein [Candidatus Dormibacteraeota bacterium]
MDQAIPISVSEGRLEDDAVDGAESVAMPKQLIRSGAGSEEILEVARTFSTQGRRDLAIDTLRQGILAHPRSPELLSLLGDLLSRAGAFEEADLYFRRALESGFQVVEAWYRQGLHLARQGIGNG